MDEPLQKVSISGPTLASLLQRFSASLSDVDGLLFGHVSHLTPSTLSDDAPHQTQPDSPSPQLVATVTSFLCPASPLSFYDSLGRLHSASLERLRSSQSHHHLIGWFSARRKSPIRPSMREFAVSRSLSAASHLSFPIRNSTLASSPCVFLLLTTPLQDQVIHTHEYRAYQFRVNAISFEPKSIDIINIGPAFRGHYGSFSPNSGFPMLRCELRGVVSAMNEDKDEVEESFKCDEVSNLRRLMGPEAASYTAGLEDFYGKMLEKLESLARQVEKSNAKVFEQENHNRKLRCKVTWTGLE